MTTKEEFKQDNPAVYALAKTIISKLQEPHKEINESQFWFLLLANYDQTVAGK